MRSIKFKKIYVIIETYKELNSKYELVLGNT